MKAERINKDQIRFILDINDLMQRNIRVQELAYGSQKTQALFDDMMKTALDQYGIDFSGKPLMIEAIPLSDDKLSITVTKVEGMAEIGALIGTNLPGEKNFGSAPVREIPEDVSEAPSGENNPVSMEMGVMTNDDTVTYEFHTLGPLLEVAKQVPEKLALKNRLLHDEVTGYYYLICQLKNVTAHIRYLIAMLSQFSSDWYAGVRVSMVVEEHFKTVIPHRALQKLGKMERGEM
ncbi:MAG: adaptor protein MecA [Firmicutes bacterium]|nr:adaptor protein MecA [Bacillota bacterium]